MPRLTTTLFTGTILIVLMCQTLIQSSSFSMSIHSGELLLIFGLLFCASGILTAWLDKPIRVKPEDDDSDSPGNNKKPPRDTAL